VQSRHKGVYWFGQEQPYVQWLLLLLVLPCTRGARSRGYKLSREGADPRSLRGRCVCVVVLARCVSLVSLCSSSICSVRLDVAPTCPFIVSKGGSGYICGKKVKWEKMKEKNKKGGLGCGRFPPYLVGAVSPIA
jgi:hypothetical protein